MKKRFVLSLLSLVGIQLSGKAQTIQGIITLQNTNKSPLTEARMVAKNGTSSFSDNVGKFEMRLPQQKAGEQTVLYLQKEGYFLAQPFQLQAFQLTEDANLVSHISAAKKEVYAQHCNTYYQILKNEWLKNIQSVPQNQLQNQLEALPLAALQLAGVDGDLNLDITRHALITLEKGNIDSALLYLEDAQLSSFSQKYTTQIAQNQKFVELGNGKLISKKEAFHQLSTAYFVKAILLEMRHQNGAAKALLHTNYLLDTTNFEVIYAQATHQALFETDKIDLEKVLLNAAKNELDTLKSWVLLGDAEHNDLNKQTATYEKAIALLEKNNWTFSPIYPYLLSKVAKNNSANIDKLGVALTNHAYLGNLMEDWQAQLHAQRSLLYYEAGKYDASLADFEKINSYYANVLPLLPSVVQQKYANSLVMTSIVYDKLNQVAQLEKTLLQIQQVITPNLLSNENAKMNQGYLALAQQRLGDLYLTDNQSLKSISAFKRANELYEGLVQQADTSYKLNINVLNEKLANLYINQKDTTNAEHYLQKTIAAKRKKGDTDLTLGNYYQYLGGVFVRKKEAAKASSFYEQAQQIFIKNNRTDDEVKNTLLWADALQLQKKNKEADSLYQFLESTSPSTVELRNWLIEKWQKKIKQQADSQQYTQAIRSIDFVNRLMKQFPPLANSDKIEMENVYILSNLYNQQKQYNKADSCLTRLVELKRKLGESENDGILLEAQLRLAKIKLDQQKYQDAIGFLVPIQATYKAQAEKEPLKYKHQWIESINYLGSIYYQQRNYPKGDSTLAFGEKLFYTLTPEDTASQIAETQLWLNLAEGKIAQKKYDEAIKPLQNASNILQNAVQNQPNKHEILWANVLKKRADLYVREKKEKEANAYYQKSLALYDAHKDESVAEQNLTHIELLLIAIDYYRDIKQKDKAIAALDKAESLLKTCPDNEICKANLEKVAELAKKLK